MIFLLVAGALIVGAPILAAFLVAIASLREDARHSLAGRPPGKLAAAARRLLCVRTESVRAADSAPTSTDMIFDGWMSDDPRPTVTARTAATLPAVPAPRLADREQADEILSIP